MAKNKKEKEVKGKPNSLSKAFAGITEYELKKQTPKHKEAMRSLAEKMLDEGFSPDDIIDVGDWILEEISIDEVKGTKEIDATKLVKKGDKKDVKQREKKAPKTKGNSDKKTKATKGKKAKGKK